MVSKEWGLMHDETEESCPHCGASLRGEKIPEELRKFYKGTHFSRKIAIYDRFKDQTVKWQCPDCLKEWDRI
jgi:hypothetical protein